MRTVYAEDAITWLKAQSLAPEASYIASLPDISEFPNFSLFEWKEWFMETAQLILSKCPDQGVTIFYQSDIKYEGRWIDKSFLCMKAAEALQSELLFHKIICRAPVGTLTFGRPCYSHLICFSKGLRLDNTTPKMADVSADIGEKTWARGIGLKTALSIAQFIANDVPAKKVFNPFCGEGSMLAAANHFGLEAVGIERSPKRAEKSERLKISPDGKSWNF